MSDDLVERLRATCSCNIDNTPCLAEEECRVAQEAADRIEELEAEVAALRASLKVLDDEPTITVAEHVDICAFLGAHLPQAAAMTKGQDDEL